ncbi:S9 family peptidase [Motiliproteus sp.]|uniref:S9 family peptidase n=1 Tax=Motiliproteus sp. TaxID=1898955 RepID=UPI003BAB007F
MLKRVEPFPETEPETATVLSQPISAADASRAGRQWAEVRTEGQQIFWLEFDPNRGANRVVSLLPDQAHPHPITPEDVSVCSRVHEYGGGNFAVGGGWLWFVNGADQSIYRQSLARQTDAVAEPVWSQEGCRYGDLVFDKAHQRLLVVEEQHQAAGEATEPEVVNRLVGIGLGAEGIPQRRVLAEGEDFYASPRVSHDGRQLAWISWNHPDQPWLSSRLQLTLLDPQGLPSAILSLTDGHWLGQSEAVVQPEFDRDGRLYFLSDRSGYWNLYRYLEGLGEAGPEPCIAANAEGELDAPCPTTAAVVEPLCPRQADFCRAPWQLGQRAYVLLDDGRIGCQWWRNAEAGLGVLDPESGQLNVLGEGAAIHSLAQVQTAPGESELLTIREPRDRPGELVCCAIGVGLWQIRALARLETSVQVKGGSAVEHIELPGQDGMPVYGLLYRPDPVVALSQPTLIIQLHGGPTAQADARFDPLKQFWLSRGFTLLDLNYRGSTGYGRDYRHRLAQRWGEADVEDVLAAARYAQIQGWAEAGRILVRGNSAGGYTVLRVLSRPDTCGIAGGASLYGISDLERLGQETHKFESHYLNWLIGDWPEQRSRYHQRSPIHQLEQFSRPLIFFQGGLDRVVPATQTYNLYNRLRARGLAVEYVAFPDERHGFKLAANRAQLLERELAFYQRQVGLET